MSASNIILSTRHTTTAVGGFPEDIILSYERTGNMVTVMIHNPIEQYFKTTAGVDLLAADTGEVGKLLVEDISKIGQPINAIIPVTAVDDEAITSGFLNITIAGAIRIRRVFYATGAAANDEAASRTPPTELDADSRIYNCSFSYIVPY